MKDWIEKRIKEMKSDNVIPLNNWREYYNRKIEDNIKTRNKLTEVLNAKAQTFVNTCRGESSDNNGERM
tara:strand:+ start:509 stop:715 length:207 start_codon:yes stop_codon:yes gene_type:complete